MEEERIKIIHLLVKSTPPECRNSDTQMKPTLLTLSIIAISTIAFVLYKCSGENNKNVIKPQRIESPLINNAKWLSYLRCYAGKKSKCEFNPVHEIHVATTSVIEKGYKIYTEDGLFLALDGCYIDDNRFIVQFRYKNITTKQPKVNGSVLINELEANCMENNQDTISVIFDINSGNVAAVEYGP